MRISDWSSDVCSSDLLDEDILRVAAIRAARPRAWIGVDANQGSDRRTLAALLPLLVEHGVAQLEQPLSRGAEADLDGLTRPLPFVADESALSPAAQPALLGRFDVCNIKFAKFLTRQALCRGSDGKSVQILLVAGT